MKHCISKILNCLLKAVLYALTPLYLLGHFINFFILSRPQKFPLKVVCIGNASCGGNHKTPIVIETAKYFLKLGKKVAVISRGYPNVNSNNTNIVKKNTKIGIESNDEALLIKQSIPECTVITSRSKRDALQKATELGVEIAILDDGMQNNTIHKDVEVLSVIDNPNNLLPYGTLREPFKWAIKRCNIVLHTADTKDFVDKNISYINNIAKTAGKAHSYLIKVEFKCTVDLHCKAKA